LLAVRAENAPVAALCERLRVPQECCDMAVLAAHYRDDIMKASTSRPEALLRLLQATDALRRPERFMQLLEVCGVAALEDEETFRAASSRLQTALAAAQEVDTGAIAKQQPDPQAIKHEVARVRLAAIRIALGARKSRRDNRQESR
jgi:tRNA nucleotidyltransferase (CCA-adding enzyme)